MILLPTIRFLCTLVFLSTLCIAGGQAQVSSNNNDSENVYSDLSLNRGEIQYLSFNDSLDPNSLRVWEQVQLASKRLDEELHYYLDSNGDVVKDVHFNSHENYYEEWMTPPTLYRTESTGLKRFYGQYDEKLPQGWPGGSQFVRDSVGPGTYVTDSVTGERYHITPYFGDMAESYHAWNSEVSSSGFLPRYEFNYPSEEELEAWLAEGYTISQNGGIITVENEQMKMIWDTLAKEEAIQYYPGFMEDMQGVITIEKYYSYNNEFDSYLLSTDRRTIPGIFSTGDCYEQITLTMYSNYGTETEEEPELRSRKEELGLEVIPNPSTDKITVNFPQLSTKTGKVSIQIQSMSGAVMMERRVDVSEKSQNFDIHRLKAGTYIILLQSGKEYFSTKFIKL